MAIDKNLLRYKDSNFYKQIRLKEAPLIHQITYEDVNDPGHIMFRYNYPFRWWSLILKLNNIIDPIEQLIEGINIAIPTRQDLKRIELEQEGR